MKKVFGILCLIIMLLTTVSTATELEEEVNYDDLIRLISEEYPMETENQEPILTGERVEEDVYEFEEQITLNQVIDGNVYVMARDLKISQATIAGNVYAMAETIEIENSAISGSLYLMGETIRLSGSASDAYIMGANVALDEDCVIMRSARILADQLKMNGTIKRNLYTTIDDLNIGDTANIDGELSYYSAQRGNISEMAKVGNVQFSEIEEEEQEYEKTAEDYLLDIAKMAFKTLLVSLIIVCVVTKFKKLPRKKAVPDLLVEMCKGIGVLILVPIVSIALIFSMIGTAVGVSLLAIYSVLLYIAIALVSTEIAYRILTIKKKEQEMKNSIIIGLAILISALIGVIGFIPEIGGGIKFLFVLMGLGFLIDMIFKKVKNQVNNGENDEN